MSMQVVCTPRQRRTIQAKHFAGCSIIYLYKLTRKPSALRIGLSKASLDIFERHASPT